MAIVKPSGKSTEQRLNDRLKNSGCDGADISVKHGDGARRTYHNIYQKGQGAHRALDMNPMTGKGRKDVGEVG